jgi:hypothetical protein
MVARIVVSISNVILTLSALALLLVVGLIYLPGSPLPPAWNPITPLEAKATPNLLTNYKLRQTINDFEKCQTALTELGVRYKVLPDKQVSDQCHIRDQVETNRLSNARVSPLKTTCGTTLRLAMWEYHRLQPAAQKHFGQKVTAVDQIGSYNCRPVRSINGPTNRMSEHATANAIDITGFLLATGNRITVLKNWIGSPEEQGFLIDARNGGCDFFRVTLSPEYNALHADHFHFDQGRWVSCR